MKIKEVVLTVPQITKLEDPNKQHDVRFCFVRVQDLPSNLPLDPNPRAQNLSSRVSHEIRNGLETESSLFHILNRGLTISASGIEHKNHTLKLMFQNENYGLIDGGHTYSIIQKYKDEIKDAYVKLEILTGIKPSELVKVAKARNTSAQVKSESLADLEGSFDWLKEVLHKEVYAHKIAWRENEQDKPIDCREIIGLITLFHPLFWDVDNPPIIGYTSKGKCLDLFTSSDKEIQVGFQSLKPIIPEILALYDHIHLKFADFYKKLGGYSGVLGEQKSSVKLGKVIEIKHYKEGFPLHYINEQGEFYFPDGWLFPIVAAHRALTVQRGATTFWRCSPRKFFDKYGAKLVEATLEASRNFGRNPNQVGKSKAHWTLLHEKVVNTVLRLTKGEEGKMIDL